MTRHDQLNGTGRLTGTPTSRGPVAQSAIGPDSEAPTRPFVGSIDRATIDRVTP